MGNSVVASQHEGPGFEPTGLDACALKTLNCPVGTMSLKCVNQCIVAVVQRLDK